MTKKLLLLLYVFFAIIYFVAPILVFADTECPSGIICLENPLKYDNVNDIINAIASLLATIAIPLSILIIIWGGIQIMVGTTTGEKESKVVQGKKTITWAVIGFAIVTLAKFLVGLVTEILAK
jgi:hypothetical protein